MQLDLTILSRYTKLANYRARVSNTNSANQLKNILERHCCGHHVYKDLSSDAILAQFEKLVERGALALPMPIIDGGRIRFEHVDSYFTDHVEMVLMDNKAAIFFVDYQSNCLGATVVDAQWVVQFMTMHSLCHFAKQLAEQNQSQQTKPIPRL